MLAVLTAIALLTGALFAGAALYITVVEHPARMGLDTATAWREWAPSYRRATWLQAPLALASLATGLGAAALGGGSGLALGALLVGAVVPFTLLVILPTNQRLLAPGLDPAAATTRGLLERWGALHAVRTGASLCGTAAYLWSVLAR